MFVVVVGAATKNRRRLSGRDRGTTTRQVRKQEKKTERLTDVNAVVVPVTTRHVLVDIGIDSSHGCDLGAVMRAAC